MLILAFLGSNCSPKKSPKVENGVLDARNWNFSRDGNLTLAGNWEFYAKELIQNQPVTPPAYYPVPKHWSMLTPNPNFATYKMRLLLGEEKKLALKIGTIYSSYKLYINGEQIFERGVVGKSREETIPLISSAYVPINKITSEELEIIFQVSDFYHGDGGIHKDIYIGTPEEIEWTYNLSMAKSWILASLILMVGMHYFLLSFLTGEKRNIYLYFALFCLSAGLRILVVEDRNLFKLIPRFHTLIYLNLEFVLEFFIIANFIRFIYSFLEIRITKYFGLFYYTCSLICLILPETYAVQFGLFIRPLILVVLVYCFFDLQKKVKNRKLFNKYSTILLFLSMAAIINDILYFQNIIESVYMFYFILLFFILFILNSLSRQMAVALQETRELTAELKNVSEVKDNFMANLSHELRTPLSLIYAYSELLSEDENDPDIAKEYSSDIFRETRVLIEIINDLMMVTDLETKLSLKIDNYNLKSIIEEAIFYLQKFKEEKQTQISIDSDEVTVSCDKSLFTKACIIIIKNSIQYGDVKGKILISTMRTESEVIIRFEDDGRGVAESDLDKIYDKFYRIDNTITYKESGVGVGLFIAKRIVDLHGGNICSYNRNGGGLGTVIRLPLSQ